MADENEQQHTENVERLAHERGDGRYPLATPAYLKLQADRTRALMFTELANLLPQDAEQATVAAHAALLRWKNASNAARAAFRDWAALDALGGSVRVQAAKDLAAGGMAPTVAEKQASDHPTYKAHKAELARLASVKDDAELLAQQELQTLLNMREYLHRFTAVQFTEHLPGIWSAQRPGIQPVDWTGAREQQR